MTETSSVDGQGLIFAAQLGREPRWTTSTSDLSAYLRGDAPFWAHLDLTNPQTETWLRETAGLPDLIVEALTAPDTRPRYTRYDEGDVLFLRGVNLNPQNDPEDMVSLRLFVTKQRVISLRLRKIMAVNDVIEDFKHNRPTPANTGALVMTITEGLIDKMRPVINDIDERLENMTDFVLDDDMPETLPQDLKEIRKRTVGLKRFIRPLAEAVYDVQRHTPDWLAHKDAPRCAESYHELTRLSESLASSHEKGHLLFEQLSHRLSEHTGRTAHLISVIAVVFVPVNFIAALLGANVGGIPGAENPEGFLWLCIAMAVLTLAELAILKIFKWI